MKTLFLITARGGSKGIPHKNLRPFCGKPLFLWSVDVARKLVGDEDICLSTDDPEIIKTAEDYGLRVPFVRPPELATDTASSGDVMIHAVKWYQEHGKDYDTMMLLQPTTPVRRAADVQRAIDLYDSSVEAVLGVTEARYAYNLLEQSATEDIVKPLFYAGGKYIRRQDSEMLYKVTGSIYMINVPEMLKRGFDSFDRFRKLVLPDEYGIDIDTLQDWEYAEYLVRNGKVAIG